MDENYEDEIDLIEIFLLLWKKLYIVLLCTILCMGSAYAGSRYLITPTYESSVMFYVNNSNISLGTVSISSTDLTASQSLVDTYIVILKTRNTLNSVIDKGNFDLSYKELSEMIDASAVNDTEVFSVTVTSEDPELACKIANTIGQVFPDKVASIVTGSSAKIVDYAVVNPVKVAPSNTKNALIGAAIGFVLSCAVIVIAYLMDETIRGEEYLTENYNIPILATIPNLATNGKSNKYYSKKYYKKYKYSYERKGDTHEKK